MSTTTIDVKDLHKVLAQKQRELDDITNQIEVKDGKVFLPDGQQAAMGVVMEEITQIETLIKGVEKNTEVKGYLAAPNGAPLSTGSHMPENPEAKSIGERFVASKEFAEAKAEKFRNGMQFEIDDASWWSDAEAKDVWSLAAGTVNRQAFGEVQQRPLVERLPRRRHLRELFPPEQTSAAQLWGIRQSGFTNAAAPVRERTAADGTSAPVGNNTDTFGTSPRSTITFENILYPMSEIRHIEKIHQTVLEDEPRLRGVVDRNMREGVRLAEDVQILSGDGNTPNMRGILQTTGVQTFNQASGSVPKTTVMRRAITRVQLAEMDATGIAVNPLDWEDMELEADSTGRLTLVTSIATGAEERVWRLPVIPTTAIAEGSYLLGAFGMGAQLFERRDLTVDISTENSDNFERRSVTVRAFERICLVVDRPEAFVKGTLIP